MTEKPTRITLAIVRQLRPGLIVWDADVKGFGIRCRKSAKTYGLKTRARGRPVWCASATQAPGCRRGRARKPSGDSANRRRA